jgi:hypothetical protein
MADVDRESLQLNVRPFWPTHRPAISMPSMRSFCLARPDATARGCIAVSSSTTQQMVV